MAKPWTPHPIAQRVQLFKPQTGNVGGRGALPSRSLGGSKGGILSRERIPPLPAHPCGTQGIPVPQRGKTFLAKGPITPPAALPTVITSRYKTARPLHAPPIVK